MDEGHLFVGEPVGLKSIHIIDNELGGKTLYLASGRRQVSMILSTRVDRDSTGHYVVTKHVNDMSLLQGSGNLSLRLDVPVVGVYRLKEMAEQEAWTYISRVGRIAYETLVARERGVDRQVINGVERTEVPRDSFFDGKSLINS